MLLTVDLQRLGIASGQKLLDVGCGEGRHCFGALARGASVFGLDLDVQGLRAHRKRLCTALAAHNQGGGFLQGDAFRLPFADESFDRVICAEVMEHVHNYPAALRELARVTKAGGRCAVTIPTAPSEKLYLMLGDDYFESPGGHIRIFKPQVLARAMADAGLRMQGCSFAHGLHTPYWALRSLVGLPRAQESKLVRFAHLQLIRAVGSKFMAAFEGKVLNYICPKSIVLYAQKPNPKSAQALQ